MNDFFAFLYECFGYIQGFSDELYNSGVYISIGFLMLAISVVGMLIYYYLINHPKFNRWWHWLFVVVLLAVINFCIAWAMSDGVIWSNHNQTIPDNYSVSYFVTFSIINALWSVIFSFAFSMLFKWKSTNCKYSPF